MLNKLVDGIFGDQKKEDKKAKAALDKARAEYEGLEIPELEDLNSDLFNYQGDLQLDNVDLGEGTSYDAIDSDWTNLSTDPVLREKQLSSLGALDSIISSGGMNSQDVANLNKIQNQTAQADRGRREAILQNMAQRGMGGSGMELLAQLQSSQAATDRASQSGLDVAGMAQQRALEAIMNQGSMAGNIRGQDFGEASQKANAQDAIAKFNASNSLSNSQFNKGNELDVKKYNVGANNTAASANWGARQDLSNMNTNVKNSDNVYNKTQKPVTSFDMANKKAAGVAGANMAESGFHTAAGDRDAAKTGAILGSGATIAAGAMMMSDENEKKEISPLSSEEIRDFLGAINPKKYRYKNPNSNLTAPGERIGFMLQDVEDTKIGKEITQKLPDGKLAYDKDNLQGVMLAALSELMKDKKEDK